MAQRLSLDAAAARATATEVGLLTEILTWEDPHDIFDVRDQNLKRSV